LDDFVIGEIVLPERVISQYGIELAAFDGSGENETRRSPSVVGLISENCRQHSFSEARPDGPQHVYRFHSMAICNEKLVRTFCLPFQELG
jgi:hypothetical protein